MFIVFLDESGQPGGFDFEKNKLVGNTSKYFTIAGFMIDADKIIEVEKKVKDIKIKYGLNPHHEIKWHTTYSKLGLTYEQNMNFKKEMLELISSYKNSTLGIVIDKEKNYKEKYFIKNHNDLYAVALHLLMERCCMEITDRKGRDTIIPAMIIADSRKNNSNNKLDKELQIAYLRAKNMGTYFVEFPNFCESIVFVDSDYYLGVQLADFCAGAIHRKYENQDDRFFQKIKSGIRTHNGNIYGAGIKLY